MSHRSPRREATQADPGKAEALTPDRLATLAAARSMGKFAVKLSVASFETHLR